MAVTGGRRARRKQALRQHISDVATGLFFARGFDAVTIDEIAMAADVSRMTVFNHFARKEDLFFDRDGTIERVVARALARNPIGRPPLAALRELAHRLAAPDHRIVPQPTDFARFADTVINSDALTARARAMRDAFAQALAGMLAQHCDRAPVDPHAQLVAALLAAGWGAAFQQAHGCFKRTGDADAARALFLDLSDRALDAAAAAVAGTPYAGKRKAGRSAA